MKVIKLDQEIIEISIISIYPPAFILKVTIVYMVYVGSSLHCSSHLVKFHQIPHKVDRCIGTICYSGVTFIEILIKENKPTTEG